MRQIAAEAGVNNSTVSLALRNSPLISGATKRKVQEIAARMGYRPDPDIARLMHHLRQRHKPRFKSVIIGLTTLQRSDESRYMRQVWEGALARAKALGYGASLQYLPPAELKRGGFLRRLRNRGVEGIVFLPQREALVVEAFPEWNWFSVVSATHGVLHPGFHRIVPDQFGNTLRICHELAGMGCRRIGYLLLRQSDQTVDHRISGAVAWQNTFGGTEPVQPLVYDSDYAAQLAKWFKRERPDAIVVGTEEHAYRVAGLLHLKIPGRVVFGVTDSREPHSFPGIDQRASDVGSGAITVLNGLLQSGERGVPTARYYTMIQGVWCHSAGSGKH